MTGLSNLTLHNPQLLLLALIPTLRLHIHSLNGVSIDIFSPVHLLPPGGLYAKLLQHLFQFLRVLGVQIGVELPDLSVYFGLARSQRCGYGAPQANVSVVVR
jgi:hypothetical protein